eukprot:XP_001611873.1 hypothetical protein [Babesia bovis T2Bo]
MALKITNRIRNLLPLCTVSNQQTKPITETNFVLLSRDPLYPAGGNNTTLTIGKHQCQLVPGHAIETVPKADTNSEGSHNGTVINKDQSKQTPGTYRKDPENTWDKAKSTGSHLIHCIASDFKFGASALNKESIFDKRMNHYALVELAKRVLQSDGMIIPINYEQLLNRGTKYYPLQLLKTISFLIRQLGTPRLNVLFIVYSKDPGRTKEDKEFYLQQEKEIEQALVNHFREVAGFSVLSFEFTDKARPEEYIPKAHKWIGKRIDLLQECPNELMLEIAQKDSLVQKLVTLQQYMRTSTNSVENIKPISSIDPIMHIKLLDIANAIEQRYGTFCVIELYRLNKWLQQNATTMADVPNDLKSNVDVMIDTVMTEYDTAMEALPKSTQQETRIIRNNLLESIQNKLMFMMDSVILKLQDDTIQQFQNDLQSLPVDDNLDINLQDMIGKYDRKYCALVEQCLFERLKGNRLYETKIQMYRRDTIENMKEVANHVLEYAIIKGMFRAKFSMVDGIPYVPSNKFTQFISRMWSKLKVPLHISLNYLSPDAFGISNWFRIVSDDPRIRSQADSMVYKPK